MESHQRGKGSAAATSGFRFVFGFALAASLSLPLSTSGCSESGVGTGGGGTGGVAGTGGEGGSGGMAAECRLSAEWQTIGEWGSESLSYGNVVLVQHPIDESLWQVVSRTHIGTSDRFDVALFRSVDEGTSWNPVSTWEFPDERRGWQTDAVMTEDGVVFVVLRDFTYVDDVPPALDRRVKLLRYEPGGDLIDVGTFQPEGSEDTRSINIMERNGVPYFIAFDGDAVPPDWYIVKYESGALETVDVIRYLNETNMVFVRDIAEAPNGKIWAVGQGHDASEEAWAATTWEEGDSGFSLIAELDADPSVKESDTAMALAFDEDGRFWMSYYTMPFFPDLTRRWRAGHGTFDAPESSFTINDDFSLDPSKASDTHKIAVHPSGVVFTGGYAIDELSQQWGIVRKGTMEGYALSDQFNRDGDGSHRTNVSSILVDSDHNVWVAYMSRPASSWNPNSTTIRKLPCVR